MIKLTKDGMNAWVAEKNLSAAIADGWQVEQPKAQTNDESDEISAMLKPTKRSKK